MKGKFAGKIISAVVVMVWSGLIACGAQPEEQLNSSIESSEIFPEASPNANSTDNNIFVNSKEDTSEAYSGKLTNITIALPSTDLHTTPNSWYDRLVAEINEHAGLNVNWQWYDSDTYYEQLEEDIRVGNVADIILTNRSEAFLNAAEEGLFWEIGSYIDDYDNIATMPEICRVGGSYNGKMYGIPKRISFTKVGLTYRSDWLEKLGLEKPTDWESFCDMLYAFTYNDPDGNGINDTVGLVLDTDDEAWDAMESWFGVPNSWGIDENGDLIHKSQTSQYRAAYAAFRKLYEQGLINNGINGVADFRSLEGASPLGWDSLYVEYKNSHGGSTVNMYHNISNVWDDLVEEGVLTDKDNIYAVQDYVDTGNGVLVYPSGGDEVGNMLAISTCRVKTEEQLKQVLKFINDICDERISDLISNGWEGETYALDENGHILGLLSNGNFSQADLIGFMTYNRGFTEIVLGYVAQENKMNRQVSFKENLILQTSRRLSEENTDNYVINAGYQLLNKDELGEVQKLEKMLYETEIQYITGEIDDAAFEAALNTWMENGGAAITEELNAKYQKAQKEGFSY